MWLLVWLGYVATICDMDDDSTLPQQEQFVQLK